MFHKHKYVIPVKFKVNRWQPAGVANPTEIESLEATVFMCKCGLTKEDGETK